MDVVQIITSVLTLFAGVGVFLISCSMMSSNLEALGSAKLKSLFSRTAKSKLVGVGVGAVTTAAIQSSSATSVMVIGFVNAGIMTLAQAATVIFGANIGTTITGQLVALGMFGGNSISSSVIFSALAGAGAFVLAFAKKDRAQKIGGILAGFGMLFVGLSLMSGAMEYFSGLEQVKNFFAMFENPLLLVLIGALFTALIQSSSVMTSMAITMVVTGLISLNQGIYITIGSNIGTCVTALIAGFTSTRAAKQTALIHLIFNVGGAAVFLLLGLFISFGGIDFGFIFSKMFPGAPQMQLSMFHTVFNIITVIIILPLTNLLVKAVTKIIPDKKEAGTGPRLAFAEEHMLKTPPIAVQQTKNEILRMSEIAIENFREACKIICTADYGGIDKFRENERTLNFLNSELAKYMSNLLKADLSEKDRVYLSTAFRTVIDLERIGDYAENIVEYSDRLKAAGGKFSDEAVSEIGQLKDTIDALYASTVKAYKQSDATALDEALAIEERVDKISAEMENNHIARLSDGGCEAETGAQYLAFASDAERVADHLVNVAKTVKAYI